MRFQFILVFCVLTAYYYVYFMHDLVLSILPRGTSVIQQECAHAGHRKMSVVQPGNGVNMKGLICFMLCLPLDQRGTLQSDSTKGEQPAKPTKSLPFVNNPIRLWELRRKYKEDYETLLKTHTKTQLPSQSQDGKETTELSSTENRKDGKVDTIDEEQALPWKWSGGIDYDNVTKACLKRLSGGDPDSSSLFVVYHVDSTVGFANQFRSLMGVFLVALVSGRQLRSRALEGCT